MKGCGQVKAWVLCVVLATVALLSSGCVISPRRTLNNPSPTPTPTPGTGGQLYVAAGNTIVRFNNAETANGASTPAATIGGNLTQLNSPQHLLLDPGNDRLYVANANNSSILIFDAASTLTGNVRPTRAIAGANTQLAAPTDMALDTANDFLYVADGIRILVFNGASTANGNLAPARVIIFTVNLGGILLDTVNNQLFASDPADNIVQVLGSATLQNLVAQPTAAFTGPDTRLSGPNGLAMDGSNRLIVGNQTIPISLTIYANAATATGDVIPSAVISGASTKLARPGQLVLNNGANNGELYVADNSAGAILVFTGISTATGIANTAPARVISSSAFSGVAISGIALDTTR